MPGRAGRGADRGYPGSCAPRYLSLAPPILPFASSSPLRGNKYEVLSRDDYPRFRNVKISPTTSIRSFSQNAIDFMDSLRGESTKTLSPTCVSKQINMDTVCHPNCTTKLISTCQSHYHKCTDPNDCSWSIFSNKKHKKYSTHTKTVRKQLFLLHGSPQSTANRVNSSKCIPCDQKKRPTARTETNSPTNQSTKVTMVSSPLRGRTRSRTKKTSTVKSPKPAHPPHADVPPANTLLLPTHLPHLQSIKSQHMI